LAANNGRNLFRQARGIAIRVEWFAGLLRAQERLQRLWPDQAAHMGGEDSLDAAFHLRRLAFDGASSRGRHSQPIALTL
jgi:hypothetical protein